MPTPQYVRDPAIGPDGKVYFAAWAGDKIASFDPKSKRFHEWDVPADMQPRGVLVARDGKVLFNGSGNNAVGELDPYSGRLTLFAIPSKGSDPYTMVSDAKGNVWFTERKIGSVAMLERASGRIVEYAIGDSPYSLTLDTRGNVWITRMAADRIVKFDPRTGKVIELSLPKGSQPRRTSIAPDGMLWVSLYGTGKLVKIDPLAIWVVKEYDLPGGPNAGPYAVNADAKGRIWVSEIQTDNVIMLDPHKEAFRVFKLPTRNTGIRKAAIDAEGRYWYVGSHAGTLGVIE
ncbi:MAG: hypothetical protein IH606_09020 [Burkholderiales bacterium]|nr:hypothetical protein [Burkholderiales bacterium]